MRTSLQAGQSKQQMSDRYKKVDTSVNGDAARLVKQHREVEKRLYPLRIDRRTVIYVPKHKCNPDYAEEYRNRHNIAAEALQTNRHSLVVDKEQIVRMSKEGRTQKEIGRKMGLSRTTVSKYIKMWEEENGKLKETKKKK